MFRTDFFNGTVLVHATFFYYFRYNRFENNREASLQTVKAPASQVVIANQKAAVEAGGDSLIDLSDDGAPAIGATGTAAVPGLNTKLAGLSMLSQFFEGSG